MIGLLLCGGKSSRMGTDKGLIADTGITWAEAACNKLAPFVSSVAISVNQIQLSIYAEHFPAHFLIVDNHELAIGGPLCGLLSAHLQMPEENIFLLACDLLFIEPVVFEKLLHTQKQYPQNNAFVFEQNEEAEPLCGIYTSAALKKILTVYREGKLGKQSMKHALEMSDTLQTALPEGWKSYFRNINTRNDLNR